MEHLPNSPEQIFAIIGLFAFGIVIAILIILWFCKPTYRILTEELKGITHYHVEEKFIFGYTVIHSTMTHEAAQIFINGLEKDEDEDAI